MKFAYLFLMWCLVLGSQQVMASEFAKPLPRVVVDNQVIWRGSTSVGDLVPIRAVVEALGGSVIWKPALREVIIEHEGQSFMPMSRLINGTAFMGSHYVDMIFDHHMERLEDLQVVAISTGRSRFSRDNAGQILPSFEGYTQEDLHWLSRLIHAEAKGEPFEGMLAVGSVVMNRTQHPSYPSGVREVIFDRRNGVQFSPTANGAIHNTPSVLSVMAAMEVLEGRRNASEALFFYNPRIARTSWISNNRDYAFSLVNHSFFY